MLLSDGNLQLLVSQQVETHESTLSIVDIDGLVLKHQAINIYSAEQIHITLNQFQTKMLY